MGGKGGIHSQKEPPTPSGLVTWVQIQLAASTADILKNICQVPAGDKMSLSCKNTGVFQSSPLALPRCPLRLPPAGTHTCLPQPPPVQAPQSFSCSSQQEPSRRFPPFFHSD